MITERVGDGKDATTMEVLSLIKNSLQQTTNDGAATLPSSSNPITKHFRLIRQTSCAGQEMVWKIYDAVRLADGKVSLRVGPLTFQSVDQILYVLTAARW